jgi:pseudouridine synthase
MLIRINKAMADKGWCSRREADEWIAEGWVFLNGVLVAEPGVKIDPEVDELTVNKPASTKRYYLLYKPRGYMSTVAENEGLSLLRLLPEPEGLFPVGRLDKDSEGIILVTDDRTLTSKIIGERSEVEKEYDVVLSDPLTDLSIKAIDQGLVLEGRSLKSCKVVQLEPRHCLITIRDGRNRQIRRVFERIGNYVLLLKRIRIGHLHIGSMKPGEFQVLTREAIVV